MGTTRPLKSVRENGGKWQGYFIPDNPHKYVGDVNKIIFRSSYELKFLQHLDSEPSVLRYNSEEVVVPYRSPVDNRFHRYFVDFWVEIKTRTGIEQKLIEIKPYSQTLEPKKKKRKSRKYLLEMKTYMVNKAKWEAASAYAIEMNAEFLVFTERELNI